MTTPRSSNRWSQQSITIIEDVRQRQLDVNTGATDHPLLKDSALYAEDREGERTKQPRFPAKIKAKRTPEQTTRRQHEWNAKERKQRVVGRP